MESAYPITFCRKGEPRWVVAAKKRNLLVKIEYRQKILISVVAATSAVKCIVRLATSIENRNEITNTLSIAILNRWTDIQSESIK